MRTELNQPVVKDTTQNIGGYIHGSRYVICPCCGEEVSLQVSYFDPYYSDTHTAQVHFNCLSQKRFDEIMDEINNQ